MFILPLLMSSVYLISWNVSTLTADDARTNSFRLFAHSHTYTPNLYASSFKLFQQILRRSNALLVLSVCFPYLYQFLFQSVFADWTKYTFSLGNVNYTFEKSRNSFCKVVYVLYFTLDKMPAWILLFKQFLWPNYINTRSVLNVHVYVNCKSGTIPIL